MLMAIVTCFGLATTTDARAADEGVPAVPYDDAIALAVELAVEDGPDAVSPAARGEIIRLLGYARSDDPRLIAWLVQHIRFDPAPGTAIYGYREFEHRRPAYYAVVEIGLPAVPALLTALRQPLPPRRSFFVTENHAHASALVNIVGHNGRALLDAAIARETDPVARRALEAARIDFPERPMLCYPQLVPRTMDLPDAPVYYATRADLRAALTSADGTVRHGALSGVLAQRQLRLIELTEAVRAPGAAPPEVIEEMAHLRPRQEECIEALVGELEEAAETREGWATQVPLLVHALARIGAPAVRCSVERIAGGLKFDSQVAGHARVIGRALGRYGDEWIRASVDPGYRASEEGRRLLAAQTAHQGLFTGGGIWGLP